MLNLAIMAAGRGAARRKQSGVVLMMALIVLVAMTLAGIALVRSVDTSNIIAGNLAFKQAATNSGDIGIETAVGWLEANNSGNNLWDDKPSGYVATRGDPASGQTWDQYWALLKNDPGNKVVRLGTDAAGNTVEYTINRLCAGNGDPTGGAGCAFSRTTSSSGSSSRVAGSAQLKYVDQVYYRITSRIAGPRNTVSFVQAIVAL